MGHPRGALFRVDGGPAGLLPHRCLVPSERDQEIPQARVQDPGVPGRPRHRHQEAGDDDGAPRPAVPRSGASGQTVNVSRQEFRTLGSG